MNTQMWRDEATQAALSVLLSRGVQVVEPQAGELACGEQGEGRLSALEDIAAAALEQVNRANDLRGKRILVTAGPTREPLDPVRFISSPSSGLTGFLLAEEAARRGAQVTLVSGPTTLPDPFDVRCIRVQTALEMLAAAQPEFELAEAAIFTAAVADFRPASCAPQKLKKSSDLGGDGDLGETMQLQLLRNPDIIATLAANKGQRYVVGYAAETQDLINNAKQKLVAKHANMIVANDVSNPALGFASRQNKVWLVTANGVEETPLLPKRAIANIILDKIATALMS
jgi:phosphopantothenoylcysteine decarboxylase/phosphopantothenate--cysteine ligase